MKIGTSEKSTDYTCPMHPEIRQEDPGSCPKCGTALEPKIITAGEEDNPELIDMTRQFKGSVALTVPLVLIAMRHFIPGISVIDRIISADIMKWLELLLATPVVLWGGLALLCQGLAVGGHLEPQYVYPILRLQ